MTGKHREPPRERDPLSNEDKAALFDFCATQRAKELPLSQIPEVQLKALCDDQRNRHIFDGGQLLADVPLLSFNLRDFTATSPDASRITFLPWIWEGFFGASLTITAMDRGAKRGMQSRVFFAQGSPIANQILESGRFRAVFFRDSIPETAFDVRFPIREGQLSLPDMLNTYRSYTPKAKDNEALFWEHLSPLWKAELSPSHRLSMSWMHAYRALLESIVERTAFQIQQDPNSFAGNLSPLPLRALFEHLSAPNSLSQNLDNYFREVFSSKETTEEFWRSVRVLMEGGAKHRQCAWVPLDSLAAHLWSSRWSKQGTRLTWYSNKKGQPCHLELDPEALAKKNAVDDYWQRMLTLHGALQLDWDGVLKGSDAPLSLDKLARAVAKHRSKQPFDAFEKQTSLALNHAWEAHHVNLVEYATVPLRQRPFATANVVQTVGDVLFVCRTQDNEFMVISVDPHGQTWATPNIPFIPSSKSRPRVTKIQMKGYISELRSAIAASIVSLRTTSASPLMAPEQLIAAQGLDDLDGMKQFRDLHTAHHSSVWQCYDVRPSDLYAYCKARFGEPNGILSRVRHPSSNNLFHWHYDLQAGDDILSLKATNSRIECSALTANPLSRADQILILHQMRRDFSRMKSEMGAVRKTLENWTLFANPFGQMASIVRACEDELRSLDGPEPEPFAPNEKDGSSGGADLQTWLQTRHRAFVLASTLRVLAPVWGEGFVNLVIFILARPDVRNDQRLYSDVIRRQIDVRLRELHLTCDGFTGRVDPEHPTFKAFHTLMNQRNDTLHANVDPARLEMDALLFDGTVPLFHESKPMHRRIASHILREEDITSALAATATVRGLVNYVLSLLPLDIRNELRTLLHINPLGYRKDTGRVGVLFSGTMAEMYATTKEVSAETED